MADILIIDDDRQMRRLITRILAAAGYATHQAANGSEGLDLFRQLHPSLIITDIVMPDMEGIETILAMRRKEPDLPIIAISGGGDPIYLLAAAKLGATGTLEKPFSAEKLLDLVDGLLSDKGAH